MHKHYRKLIQRFSINRINAVIRETLEIRARAESDVIPVERLIDRYHHIYTLWRIGR